MSYNPIYEASKALPVERIAKKLEDFATAGQDLSRRRFSRSPPPLPSGPSTAYEESNPPSPGEQLRDRENKELQNSTADEQFAIQVKDELDRIRTARDKGLLWQPNLSDWDEAAEANVKYRWMRQGIWDDQWDIEPGKIWKHELEDIPQPAGPSHSVKGGKLGTKKKDKYSELQDEYQEIVRSAVDPQQRQLSRPCYQFVHQFCEERQWIKMGLSREGQDQHANLDTKAYESLKSRWIREGIWDDDWTLIPGVSWKHERPQKIPPPQEMFRRADALKATRMEQAERPPDWYFMASTELLTIFDRDLSPSFPSKCASDPSRPSTLEPSSEVIPPGSDRSVTSRTSRVIGLSRSTRQSTAKAKPNAARQEHNQRPTKSPAKKPTANATRTKPTRKTPRKRKDYTPELRIAKSRPLKERISAKEETNHQSTQEAKTQISNYTSFPKPRRAAALAAMEKLTKAT